MEARSERGLFGSLIPLPSCGGDRESRERGKLWTAGELKVEGGAEPAEYRDTGENGGGGGEAVSRCRLEEKVGLCATHHYHQSHSHYCPNGERSWMTPNYVGQDQIPEVPS
jgi:hypothetical protein